MEQGLSRSEVGMVYRFKYFLRVLLCKERKELLGMQSMDG